MGTLWWPLLLLLLLANSDADVEVLRNEKPDGTTDITCILNKRDAEVSSAIAFTVENNHTAIYNLTQGVFALKEVENKDNFIAEPFDCENDKSCVFNTSTFSSFVNATDHASYCKFGPVYDYRWEALPKYLDNFTYDVPNGCLFTSVWADGPITINVKYPGAKFTQRVVLEVDKGYLYRCNTATNSSCEELSTYDRPILRKDIWVHLNFKNEGKKNKRFSVAIYEGMDSYEILNSSNTLSSLQFQLEITGKGLWKIHNYPLRVSIDPHLIELNVTSGCWTLFHTETLEVTRDSAIDSSNAKMIWTSNILKNSTGPVNIKNSLSMPFVLGDFRPCRDFRIRKITVSRKTTGNIRCTSIYTRRMVTYSPTNDSLTTFVPTDPPTETNSFPEEPSTSVWNNIGFASMGVALILVGVAGFALYRIYGAKRKKPPYCERVADIGTHRPAFDNSYNTNSRNDRHHTNNLQAGHVNLGVEPEYDPGAPACTLPPGVMSAPKTRAPPVPVSTTSHHKPGQRSHAAKTTPKVSTTHGKTPKKQAVPPPQQSVAPPVAKNVPKLPKQRAVTPPPTPQFIAQTSKALPKPPEEEEVEYGNIATGMPGGYNDETPDYGNFEMSVIDEPISGKKGPQNGYDDDPVYGNFDINEPIYGNFA